MTERQSFNLWQTRMRVFTRDGFVCQRCGDPAVYLAHRIAQTKSNIKKYGEAVIHHEDNLVSVCFDPVCNDSFNIGGKPVEAGMLSEKILEKING